MHWNFEAKSSLSGWGWRFTVYPVLGPCHVRGSDRAILSQPSVELATCLLDSRLTLSSDRVLVSRLATAMAACAQLSTLGKNSIIGWNSVNILISAPGQRMWALQGLRRLINTVGRAALVSEKPDSALSSLLRGLPQALFRQFEYEDPLVKTGKHLTHSAFFKVLVALACDLG